MDSYLSQTYLLVTEYNKTDWNSNASFRIPIPNRYQLAKIYVSDIWEFQKEI